MGREAARGRRRGAALVAAGALVAGSVLLATSGDGAADDRYRGCDGADANYDAMYPDFPADSAQQWLSYGDHVAVFHPRPGSERRARGVDAPRSAVLVVDEVLHSREGAKPLPDSFRAVLWEVPCDSRVQPGHTYLGLLVFDAVRGEPAAWRPVHGGGLLPYDGESIGTGEIEGRVGETPAEERSPFGLEKQMHGEHAGTLQSLLEVTEPYALAARHPDLSPGERHQLVYRARTGAR